MHKFSYTDKTEKEIREADLSDLTTPERLMKELMDKYPDMPFLDIIDLMEITP